MQIKRVSIDWLGHAGFLITQKSVPFEEGKNSKVIYIDPYQIKEGHEKADIILITHSHYDHCSVADIQKIVKEGTKVIMTADCQSKIMQFSVPIIMKIIEPGQTIDLPGIRISAIPAYNIDKHFHTKEEQWVGFIIKIDDLLIYHAGDTDLIPEMQKLTGHSGSNKDFIALLPVGGRFTMTAEEAAEAATLIKPSIAIPMHWGSIIGTEDDANEFIELCRAEGIKTKKLEKL